MHPISGVPLSRNVPRNVYRIPPEIIENLPNGVIDISKVIWSILVFKLLLPSILTYISMLRLELVS